MAKFVDEAGQQQVWQATLARLEGDEELAGKVDKISGKTLSSNDYSNAEKDKLTGIAAHANNYALPVAGLDSLGGVRTTSEVTSSYGYIATPIIGGIPYYQNTDTRYEVATSSSAGLMSAEDKVKLDSQDSNLSSYTLPVAGQNTLGGVRTTSTVTSTNGLIPTPIINGVPYYSNTNTTYAVMTGATANSSGNSGLVPAPSAGDNNKFLRADGTWQLANYYSLPTASPSAQGGIKIGSGLAISNGVASVPTMTGATANRQGIAGLVPPSDYLTYEYQTNLEEKFLNADGTWKKIPEATSWRLGGVKIGTGITMSSGTISIQSISNATINSIMET